MTMSTTVYDIITEKVVAALAKGIVPWARPWRVDGLAPMNLVSKREYRGINVFLLAMEQAAMGPEATPYWLSYNQAKALGGNVRKGSKGTQVVFWKMLEGRANSTEGDDADSPKGKKIPMLRYYTVFNLSQCDGLDEMKKKLDAKHKADSAAAKPIKPVKKAENIVKNLPTPAVRIEHKVQARAFYSPSRDTITMPPKTAFVSVEGYYGTLFHEITHSTGHKSRLDRLADDDALSGGFGSPGYAREELVAELGAAFLCGEAGVTPNIENSAAYIRNWLTALKNDTKLVVIAAQRAQKAADYVLGRVVEYAKDSEAQATAKGAA